MQDPIVAPPAPPPAAPPEAAVPRDTRLRGLRLPPPGWKRAQLLGVVGAAFYIVFNTLMIQALVAHGQSTWGATVSQMIGLGADGRNYPLLVLISLGFVVFLFACLTTVRDTRQLAEEEEDVDWVNRTGKEGLGLVFAPSGEREAMFRRGQREATHASARVDTLMDDRVRRVLEKERDRYTLVSPDELRVIAETRTSRYGSVARFSSSLLLLLAVLGTFAGVKTALPGLIDAVSQTGAGGQGTGAIIGPLQAVADAFGGNALALVGAIAAGLMAQGLSMGRRNLLERLELVSSEYLYGGLQTGSMDPLTSAVNELRDTAGHVRDAGESIAGVEAAMAGLGEAFRTAFGELNERLVTIVEQQDQALHERTSKDLRELQRRVVEMAAVVEANTRAYAGIVDGVEQRGAESRQMVAAFQASVAGLQDAFSSVGRFQEFTAEASKDVRDTIQVLREGGDAAAQRMQTAASSLERTEPAIAQVERLLVSFQERSETLNRQAAEAWSSASREVNERFAELIEEMQARNGRGSMEPGVAVAAAGSGRDPELASLLRRVAAAVEERPSTRTLALAHASGIVGAAAALGAAYGVYHLVVWIF